MKKIESCPNNLSILNLEIKKEVTIKEESFESKNLSTKNEIYIEDELKSYDENLIYKNDTNDKHKLLQTEGYYVDMEEFSQKQEVIGEASPGSISSQSSKFESLTIANEINKDLGKAKESVYENEAFFPHQDNQLHKRFKCSICKYQSNYKQRVDQHLLTHSTIKLFKCSECSYECNHKNSLKIHLLTHLNIKLFRCPECPYECSTKHNLQRHLLVHSNIKILKCSKCIFECNDKSSLNRHILTHSDTKLFKCSECDYEGNRRDRLKIHLMTHSDTKLLKCSQCDYECNLKSHLQRHSKRIHNL